MLLFCAGGHRYATREYWIGLYKLTPTPDGTTLWYDGNPSTFRHWYDVDPDENTACVRLFLNVEFRDKSCNRNYYYTCKKAAGNYLFIPCKFQSVFREPQICNFLLYHEIVTTDAAAWVRRRHYYLLNRQNCTQSHCRI